jgi:hypothetical protein
VNAAATSFRIRVCSGGSSQSRLQPLAVPEGLPARVERLGGRELVLRAEVAEVAAQSPVAEARAHIGVARDEPALEGLLVEERRLFAQRRELRIRIGEEGRVGRVEVSVQVAATIVIPPRAFCRSVTCTFSAGSSSACAASSRIRTARASQNAPSFRKLDEVELERLGLDAELLGLVLDGRDVHVRLVRNRAHRDELVARHLDPCDTRVRERLDPRVVLRARVAEGDELGGALVHAA